ncbi:hypothetical protein RSOLAG1IB_07290 [Rhizoctonia solani AG-1 IB]|uniref:Uncharacterized protein n=1 Tax=Thanatephorus cucumeris (strain AG1-IB / isolate 7/3/14) TaxID=1108050 RepID=A0A0B7F9L0_THACB|nr:hypothetical protein RSOLAG1IB_07290 [Rhizoctonia solani AG-1 IB]
MPVLHKGVVGGQMEAAARPKGGRASVQRNLRVNNGIRNKSHHFSTVTWCVLHVHTHYSGPVIVHGPRRLRPYPTHYSKFNPS